MDSDTDTPDKQPAEPKRRGPKPKAKAAKPAKAEPVKQEVAAPPEPEAPAVMPPDFDDGDDGEPQPQGIGDVKKAREAPSPFGVSVHDMRNFMTHQFETDKKMALDALEQACKDAATIAANKVRTSPEGKALIADIGNVEKRKKFLDTFGPSKLIPPRPTPGLYGDKSADVLKWDATYEPEKFKARYANSKAPDIIQLLKEIASREA
jgi:hypothetical protein